MTFGEQYSLGFVNVHTEFLFGEVSVQGVHGRSESSSDGCQYAMTARRERCRPRIVPVECWRNVACRECRWRRVVDSTAPWGRPAGVLLGVEDASFNCTENERPTRKARRMQIRYGGS